jgi:hypothetical protein
MKTTMPTVQELHFICATAHVAVPTAQKYFYADRPMRPAMVQRIEVALRDLGLEHLLRHSPNKSEGLAS